MFRHYVVRQRHPRNPLKRHEVCLCGYTSPWQVSGRYPDHPHNVITMSRTDLRRPSDLVGIRYVCHLKDGTWEVVYKCGHETHGVSDFDLAVARRSHTAIECQEQPASVPGPGSPCEGDPVEGRPTAHKEQSTNG